MNSDRLGDADMLALLKLANQLHELPANPVVRHETMLAELCRLSGACAGISALIDSIPREPPCIMFMVHFGLEDIRQQSTFNHYMRALDEPLTAPQPLIRLLESRSWEHMGRVGNTRGDIPDVPGDCIRYARDICRPLKLGHAIFSSIPLRGSKLSSALSIHRALDDTRLFTDRQRRVVRLFHSQIGWMFGAQLPAEPSASASLSPRQQQTLRHLLAGDSEKQIAHRLGRSQHTVHTYVKAIHRNFHVSSRGELLALFVR